MTGVSFQRLISVSTAVQSTVTWSATNKASGVTLSGGNLIATGPANYGGYATASTSGNIYWEAVCTNLGSIARIGMCDSSWAFSTDELGDGTHGISYRPSNGMVRYNNVSIATLPTSVINDVISIAWSSSSHKIWFRINGGNWNNSGSDNPATDTGGYSNMTPTGNAFPAYEVNGSSASWTARFASASWSYAAPSGFGQIL